MDLDQSKICRICFETKSIGMFYVHKEMADGYLNVCIKCVKYRANKRHKEKLKDPEWVESERTRHRDKFHRLHKNWKPQSKDAKKKAMQKYKDKYPEKYIAKNLSNRIDCPDGYHRHHWSYALENAKDVIIVTIAAHYYFHRHHIYDQERMAYRNKDGVLMDKVATEVFMCKEDKSD